MRDVTSRSLVEIETALRGLVQTWGRYFGTERSGAQSFWNDLVSA